jgi:hypothetical protein
MFRLLYLFRKRLVRRTWFNGIFSSGGESCLAAFAFRARCDAPSACLESGFRNDQVLHREMAVRFFDICTGFGWGII